MDDLAARPADFKAAVLQMLKKIKNEKDIKNNG